jgi:ATP-dependent DNA helicase PIF1
MSLNEKQSEALEIIKSGHSVFITGCGGSGKSHCIQSIIKYATEAQLKFGVTASTGLAAYLIGGSTLHSFLGIGLGTDPLDILVKKIYKIYPFKYFRMASLDLLIIDEISMIDINLFDKISKLLSIIKKNETPFGGIQLVLSGDFCQLPPVNGSFCFLSETWKTLNINVIVLTEIIRQSGDKEFQNILNELRWGKCTDDTLTILQNLKNNNFSDDILPTKLYSLNVNVDKINNTEYNKLLSSGSKNMVYKTIYSKNSEKSNTKNWADSIKIPTQVDLCMGAQVLVKYNLDISETNVIVNGTRGVIVNINKKSVNIKLVNDDVINIPYITLTCADDDKLSVSFMPLKLAYCLTIHNSQGCTLDSIEIDIGKNIFEYGQAYVALSRAKSLSSVKIIDVSAKSFKTHPRVKEFYSRYTDVE